MDNVNSADSEIFSRRDGWFTHFRKWKFLGRFLLIWIAIGSAIAASDLLPGFQRWVSLSVAMASAVLAALNPDERANAYRRAWIVLDAVIMKERGIPPAFLDAISVGESIIGEAAPSANK